MGHSICFAQLNQKKFPEVTPFVKDDLSLYNNLVAARDAKSSNINFCSNASGEQYGTYQLLTSVTFFSAVASLAA